MSVRVIYEPKKHLCDLPDPRSYEIGTIVECLDCSTRYQTTNFHGMHSSDSYNVWISL